MTPALICIPFLSALTGWMTARLIVIFIFHPAKPIHLGLFHLQGFIYKNENALKELLYVTIKTEMKSMDEIGEKLASSSAIERLKPELNDHIDVFLRLRLKEAMPMIGMLIGDRTISQLKSLFMEELETLFPSVIKSYFMHMKNDPSLDELIRERIDSIDMHSAQKFFKEKISTQVTKFNLLAGVLGFLIGCLQLLIIIISLS